MWSQLKYTFGKFSNNLNWISRINLPKSKKQIWIWMPFSFLLPTCLPKTHKNVDFVCISEKILIILPLSPILPCFDCSSSSYYMHESVYFSTSTYFSHLSTIKMIVRYHLLLFYNNTPVYSFKHYKVKKILSVCVVTIKFMHVCYFRWN